MDSCRICLKKNNGMSNIFEGDDNFANKILFCTGIQFTKQDGLSPQICSECITDLSIAHRFKMSCITIAKSFQKLTSDIKCEDNDDCSNVYETDDIDMEEDVILKREIDEVSVKQETAEDNAITELAETVAKKKRGPYKKKGNLKQTKRNGQPKVKKKTIKEVKSKETELDSLNAKKNLQCVPCSLTFDSRRSADSHRITVHKEETNTWVCEICGQKFMHRGSLSTHIRSHFPPMFACTQCSYRAAHKYDLTKHQRIHAGVRPFQCDMCPASFYDASNLNSHIRRNHQKVMKFRCEVCGRGFYDKSKLNRHVDSHNNVKRHSCSQCGCAFTRLSYLKSHLHKRHGISLPALRPGPQRKNLIVDIPPSPPLRLPPEAIGNKNSQLPPEPTGKLLPPL